ncbi:uncharacterized protein LOC109812611 [Cajanus cajan]|uniref:DUF4220 domain-containing protein n=1 Tax=Cajanus cajan TaxID=3821 RepID=A0A151S6T8_CAJCA|nr:uncharacterized protein LOC109812611 [Cajanus cajan]KYP50499.1 hypothetical protein KK1_027751 [Cajanus cajan]
MAFTKKRTMLQIFPPSLRDIWDKWELRFVVLSSLIFQITLVLLGNKRKHRTSTWLRITLWFSYLLADWLATISLGVLSNKVGDSTEGDFVEPKYVIISLWAPLLLIHLGGSDTMTAYSMEDNELWGRRFLSFIVQIVVALYIFLRVWTDNDLNVLAIPIFVAGIVKMGERIWVLWSASSQQFKESLFPDPDPGPNYARYMETYIAASHEGFLVDVQGLETPSIGDDHTHAAAEANIIPLPQTDTHGPDEIVKIAHNFLKTFKPLFADLILSFQDVLESRLSLQNGIGEEVFQVMEVELGFMYDLFYTKAAVTYSFMGSFLRLVTISCNVSVLCGFFSIQKNQYPKVDVFVTYVLLLGAITLEIYSVISLYILSPDWTMLWLSGHKNKVTSHMMRALKKVKNKRWSSSIGQFNLISFCLKAKEQRCSIVQKLWCFMFGKGFRKKVGKCSLVRMIIDIYQSYQKYKCTDIKIVNDDLKNIIFEHFINKIKEVNMTEEVKDEEKVADEIKRFCYHRGNKVLERFKCSAQLGWSFEGEFDQSILLWHIATDLCYNCVSGEGADTNSGQNFREASKLLSEYMLFLLVMRPSMLPNGIGEIRFQDTCAEATEFVKDRKSIKRKKEAFEMLLIVSSESENVHPSQVKGDRSKSILFDACRLAMRLTKLRNEDEGETKRMWELITQVWVEMLGYAASHCQGIHHAQQLRHGGELLTHVCLLMAHLGITDQFQISKGHARKKLIRK